MSTKTFCLSTAFLKVFTFSAFLTNSCNFGWYTIGNQMIAISFGVSFDISFGILLGISFAVSFGIDHLVAGKVNIL